MLRGVPSIIYKLKYFFLLILYVVGEIINSDIPNLVKSIVDKTEIINPYNMTNITSFAYFSVDNASYPTIYDEYVNFSIFGGIIRRKVEYCQYKQEYSSNGIYTYSKSWVPNYINSTDFLDKNYINPPLSLTVEEKILLNNVTIGNITVSSSFYTNDLLFYYSELDTKEEENFTFSMAGSQFEYIKRGFFYHSNSNESARTRLEKYQNRHKKSDDKLKESQAELFDKCKLGDIRFRYICYAPRHANYFGYVENFVMKPVYVDDVRFGATSPSKKLKELVQAFTPNGIYKDYENKIVDFFTYSYVFVAKLKISYDTFALIVRMFFNDQRRIIYWLLAAGIANLAFRSLIWDTWILNFNFWFSMLVLVLVIGLFFGIWKIQLHQYNNRTVNVRVRFDRETLIYLRNVLNNMENLQANANQNNANRNNTNQNGFRGQNTNVNNDN